MIELKLNAIARFDAESLANFEGDGDLALAADSACTSYLYFTALK